MQRRIVQDDYPSLLVQFKQLLCNCGPDSTAATGHEHNLLVPVPRFVRDPIVVELSSEIVVHSQEQSNRRKDGRQSRNASAGVGVT